MLVGQCTLQGSCSCLQVGFKYCVFISTFVASPAFSILKFSFRRLGWTAKILNSTQWTFGTGSENRALVLRGHVLRSSWEVHIVNRWQVKTLSTQIGFLLCRRHSWAFSCQSQARPIKIHMFLSSLNCHNQQCPAKSSFDNSLLKCRYLLTEHLIRISFVESFLNIWTFDQGYQNGDWREIIK